MGFSWAKLLFWKTSTLPEKPYFLTSFLAKVLYLKMTLYAFNTGAFSLVG